MKLPSLPEPAIITDVDWCENEVYHVSAMLQFQRDTVEACCQVLLESGFKSNGVPEYEHLVEKLRSMK